MKRSNVFVGPGNIAGNASIISCVLREIGINAVSLSYRSHPFGFKCDFDNILIRNTLSDFIRKKFFIRLFFNKYSIWIINVFIKASALLFAIIKYDSFIFISHETFFRNNKDLILLKKLKKRIVFLFVGCPERDPSDVINNTDGGYCSFCEDFNKQNYLKCNDGDLKKDKIQFLSKYADIIFSHKDTISFVRDKSIVRTFFCVSDIDIQKKLIRKKFKNIDEIYISHFPSNEKLKGTKYVQHSIKYLKDNNYNIKFLNKRIQHSEIKSHLLKTHILIDQFASVHGLLSVEGMASGCVVICRTSKWFREDNPYLPIISCEPDDLTEVLIKLISNRALMVDIALRTYDYFQKYHSVNAVGNYYKETIGLVSN